MAAHHCELLAHICGEAEWLAAQASSAHTPPSLEEVGFIHLSAPRQVHVPANLLYAGRDDLVLLLVEPGRIEAPIRWEQGVPPAADGSLFPHLYGPLPCAAVRGARPYRPGPDGAFAPLEL
ncbi:protein of unknown function DUF952 [Segniliparus rotundus DSM 44985]|uniref:Glutathione S-transferase domain protein n=1 Tax=Segniliparus rotundus (strain ATCC BAA-972 / CDC 1076 / CIP 108378 / DSM 44985 / JCM 13578) TaxID=640132 RepID=D6ZCB8_SEGRD|nr:DUF952 domain-containing protein [Segniliparus rotundus]ADG99087.1 protein of unknown function DUF952 [Segniliparus rotundus DSM 44985]